MNGMIRSLRPVPTRWLLRKRKRTGTKPVTKKRADAPASAQNQNQNQNREPRTGTLNLNPEPPAAGVLLLAHERIREARRRRKGFLDGPRTGPSNEIQLGPCLVVRPRRARAAERLLADDRSGRL